MNEYKKGELIKLKMGLDKADLTDSPSLLPEKCKITGYHIYGGHMTCVGCRNIVEIFLKSNAAEWMKRPLVARGDYMPDDATMLDAYTAQLNWCYSHCPKLPFQLGLPQEITSL